MRKNIFFYIFILVTITLIGAIVTQVVWIQNVWTLKDNQFQFRVVSGLKNVSNQNLLNLLQEEEQKNGYIHEEILDNAYLTRLDSLIRIEFADMEINEDYDYKIEDNTSKILFSSRLIPDRVWEEALRLNFVTHDFKTLNIYFLSYKRDKQIFNDLVVLPIMSGLFLILLLYGFLFTIYYYRAQKKLADLKADFINNMTHEFKTPIATVSVSSDILLRPEINHYPDKIERYARIIRAENKRLETQVDRVLQISRLEKGSMKIEMETLDAHEIITECIQNFQVNVNERNGKLETRLLASSNRIVANKMHLTNIVMNLIENALKYSVNQPHILVETTLEDARLKISVIDHGIGIRKDKQKQVFEKFFRIQQGDIHNAKGFGLGLYYVKTITELMGGEIHLESIPGKGTRIDLFFAG